MRRLALLAVVLVAVACGAAPAPGPRTTSIRRTTPRPASWLAEELAARIRLLKPRAFVEVVQPGEVQLRLAPQQEPVRVYAARAADPCAIGGDYCDEALDRLATKAIEVAEHELHPIDRDLILPRVADTAMVDRFNNLTEESLVTVERQLAGDLRVIYGYSYWLVSSRSKGYDVVRQRDLIRLQLGISQLHDLAVANLAPRRGEFQLQPITGTPAVWRLEREPEKIKGYAGREMAIPRDVHAGLFLDPLWNDAMQLAGGEIAVLIL